MSIYRVGAILEVDLLQEIEDAASQSSGSVTARFRILHAYTPFTLSVVLRARLLEASSVLVAGSIVVLKILDRSQVDPSGRQCNGHEWTENREHLARERWQAISDGTLPNDFDEQADLEDWPEAWIEEDHHRRSAVCRNIQGGRAMIYVNVLCCRSGFNKRQKHIGVSILSKAKRSLAFTTFSGFEITVLLARQYLWT